MKTKCVICGKEIREKNVLGINKKLLGEDIINFYFHVDGKNHRLSGGITLSS